MEENVGKSKKHETPVKNPLGAELTTSSGSNISEQPGLISLLLL